MKSALILLFSLFEIYTWSTVYTSNAYEPINPFYPPDEQWCPLIVPTNQDSFFICSIYNRWGEMVWQTNDTEEGWDGINCYTNEPAAIGVYYVIEKAIRKQDCGKDSLYRYQVTLLRGYLRN